jgi:quinoprotein glucose dehydrogenase
MRAVGARVFLAFVALCCVAHGAAVSAQYGGAGGRHYTRSAQIDRGNVARLERAWEYRIDDADALPLAERHLLSYQASPLKLPAAAGGLLLLCTPLSRVVALDPETGAERWRFDPQVRRDTLRPFNCRGVSYWDAGSAQHCGRRVFVATYDRRLIALDAATGERCSGFGVRGEVDIR